MIEIGYNFLKKDLDKIQKFKNPTLDIVKSKLNKIGKYKTKECFKLSYYN